MKKQKIALTALPVAAILLELLPYGAVLNFASPDSEPIRRTYSYFDLTPYGYANFAPFLTALLTCALLVLGVVYLWKGSSGLRKAITIVALIAAIVSVAPLLYGLRSFSVVGALISLVLLAEFCLSLQKQA